MRRLLFETRANLLSICVHFALLSNHRNELLVQFIFIFQAWQIYRYHSGREKEAFIDEILV